MAAQLIATNRLPLRSLRAWMARATSSLPVPLSPSSSTETLLGATFSTMRHTFCIDSSVAMMPSSGLALAAVRSRRFSASSPAMWKARCTMSLSTSVSTGLE